MKVYTRAYKKNQQKETESKLVKRKVTSIQKNEKGCTNNFLTITFNGKNKTHNQKRTYEI